ncbi:MAG: hypothetical protein HYT22_03755 [Candidatus Niyogibacteria bacterium]|nr:hypothetical protein [Candidatus Niyogibacteria bacterium]
MTSKSTAKDFFLNLIVIAGLYATVGFLVSLLFSYIDLWVPDPLNYGAGKDAVRLQIAALVVIFPIFIWASWFLERVFKAEPEKRKYWVRTWLLYFTLFVAGVILAGDLVAVIWRLLGGDVTGRFLLKVAAILVVAGSVFKYYIFELLDRSDWKQYQKWIAWFAMAAVAIAVIAGFVVAGSPAAQRALRFDERRVSDLQTIQWQIVSYWQAKQTLPKTFADLNDPISGFVTPTDPETGENYGYVVKAAPQTFELCATFNRPSDGTDVRFKAPMAEGLNENWAHGEGRVCFARTIDPDRYPPFSKPAR